ncbi:MAG: hypothetical protein ABEI52_03500 [Halobacteriaceae archaeon]
MSGALGPSSGCEQDKTTTSVSRRSLLQSAGAAITTGVLGTLAGCTGGDGGGETTTTTEAPTKELYIVAFHWGFRQLTPDGTVVDQVTTPPGTDLTLHGVNVEPIAEGEDLDVPDPVYTTAKNNYKDWEEASLERIAGQTDGTVEEWHEKLETAEKKYKTHGVGIMTPDDEQLMSVKLPPQEQPVTKTVTLDTTGAYTYRCTEYCGPGHSYMVLNDAINVES